MKISAYVCDSCNKLLDEEEVLGIEITQPNLFENKFLYRADKPKKCDIHFCLECHSVHVVAPCSKIKRTKDDKEYTYYYDLYTKKFYEYVHNKSLLANHSKNKR